MQALLDDHILKSQSMRGSPFIAALGKKATDWEEKLINMQDVMDIWVQVQSTWMYLEPIFSSEDIMRQMPVEGRNFKAVRRNISHNLFIEWEWETMTYEQNMLNTLFSVLCVGGVYRWTEPGGKL